MEGEGRPTDRSCPFHFAGYGGNLECRQRNAAGAVAECQRPNRRGTHIGPAFEMKWVEPFAFEDDEDVYISLIVHGPAAFLHRLRDSARRQLETKLMAEARSKARSGYSGA